jgi:glycosyltransferase involved in cell wall biosynthesis
MIKDLEKNSETMPRIWLVNFNAMPPQLESRLRTIKFAQYLTEFGYDVTIFSSSIMHNMDIDLITDGNPFIQRNYDGLKFVHIKTKKYKTNGFLRIYSLIEFHIKLCRLKNRFLKPDFIIHGSSNPFGNFFYYCAKKLKAKYIVEVQDLWPESFVSYGLISKRNPLLKIAYLTEKWLYKKADKLVFSMEGGKDYIINKKWDSKNNGPVDLSKVYYVSNGVDMVDFDNNLNNYRIADNDLEDNSFFRVTYIGSIRHVNNIKELIDAAALLLDEKNLKFLIYGDGGERLFLEEYCRDNGITNVVFKQKWVDPKYVPYILSKSSLNILNYMQNDIWKYGGSQSKLFQYLASGKPICSNLHMGYCLINKYNLGIAKPFISAHDYSSAIMSLVNLNNIEYDQMCERVREVAKRFDYELLVKEFSKILNVN